MCKKIEVVMAADAAKFQEAFNSKMSELEKFEPEVEFNHGQGFCAYLIYSDNSRFQDIVEEPVNDVICDTCLRRIEEPKRHCKWRKCAIFGSVNKKEPVCDKYIPRREARYGN